MARADRVAQLLAELLRPTGDGDGLALRLVTAGRETLDVTGIGLAWMTEQGPVGTVAVAGAAAEVMEELQYSLGTGPGVDSSRSGRPEMHPDLTQVDIGRWPGYPGSALEAGVAAVFAFPLQVGGIKLGVLSLYNDTPGRLAQSAVEEARALAVAATAVLLHLQSSAGRGGGLHADLADTVFDRAEVYQATGMVSVQIKSSLTDAFAVLRGRAFSSGREVSEVAHSVVTRELRFTAREM